MISAVGLAFAVVSVESVSGEPASHFNPMNYIDPVGGAHVLAGLAVMVLLAFQLVSGVVIDKLFDPDRVKTPIMDKMHWWVGRLSVLGGIVNVYLGLALWNILFESTSVWYIAISVWLLAVVGFFAVCQRVFGQTHDNVDKGPMYDADSQF